MGWFNRERRRDDGVVEIAAKALRERLARGERVLVVDVRQPHDLDADPVGIPGARRMPPAELPGREAELEHGLPIVLYCS